MGRKVIMDSAENVYAYELLFIDAFGKSKDPDSSHQTATVISSAINLQNLDHVIDNKLAYVSVNGGFLEHEMMHSVPKETFVLQLNVASLNLVPNMLIQNLSKEGFRFCLVINELESGIEIIEAFKPYLYAVKIDMKEITSKELEVYADQLVSFELPVIISGVLSVQECDYYKNSHFKYFQGPCFSSPEIVHSKLIAPEIDSIIDLVNKLTCQAPHNEISEGFSRAPNIMLLLLQYLNSSQYHFKVPIKSIDQMITLLGHETLRRWLFLTLYASNKNSKGSNALLEKVVQRTELIVELYVSIFPSSSNKEMSEVNFLGLLSLIETVIDKPIEQILKTLTVDEAISDAILEHKGFLGELLEFAVAVEDFNIAKVQEFIEKHRLSPKTFEAHLMRSIEKSDSLTF